jgi:small subunit ribosomal protein S13
MPRIAGVDIPNDKKVEYSLPYVQGLGLTSARKLLSMARIEPTVKAKDLSDEEISRINQLIEQHFTVEGELRREVNDNIKRLVDIGTYRGTRHKKSLPARGQRTRHNARTRRGKKQTVGGMRRVLQKT